MSSVRVPKPKRVRNTANYIEDDDDDDEDEKVNRAPAKRSNKSALRSVVVRLKKPQYDWGDSTKNRAITEKYEADLLAQRRQAVKELDDEGVLREERADLMLRYECEVKGIASTGVRVLLLERLEKHGRGEEVMQTGHTLAKNVIRPDKVTHFTPAHQTNRRALSFELDGICCLPHDLIRMILPFVDNTSLFVLAHACKYLNEDVMPYLRARAIKEIGHTNATPLALSCYLYYRCYYSIQYGTFFHKHLAKELGTPGASKRSTWHNGGTTQKQVSLYPEVDCKRGLAARATICQCINTYGTVEGWLKTRQMKLEKRDLRTEELKVLARDAPGRLKILQAEITRRLNLPPLFKESANLRQTDRGRKFTLDLTLAGKMLLYGGSRAKYDKSWLAKATDHVFKCVPVQTDTVIEAFSFMLSRKHVIDIVKRVGKYATAKTRQTKVIAYSNIFFPDVFSAWHTDEFELHGGYKCTSNDLDNIYKWICSDDAPDVPSQRNPGANLFVFYWAGKPKWAPEAITLPALEDGHFSRQMIVSKLSHPITDSDKIETASWHVSQEKFMPPAYTPASAKYFQSVLFTIREN